MQLKRILMAVSAVLMVTACLFTLAGCNRQEDAFKTHDEECVYTVQATNLDGTGITDNNAVTHYGIRAYQRQEDNDVIIKATSSGAEGTLYYGTATEKTVDRDTVKITWYTADDKTEASEDNPFTKCELVISATDGDVINDVIIDFNGGSITKAE